MLEAVSSWDREFVAAIRRHYTGSRGAPPGRKLAYRVVERHGDLEVLRGWLGVGEPSFKLAPRRRLGLADARPAPRTVSVFIARFEREGHAKASAIYQALHERAAEDWRARWGWAPEHWETLVDPAEVASANPGASFRRAGYRTLGYTTGRSARRPAGSTHGPRVWCDASPKLVLYRGPLPRLPLQKVSKTASQDSVTPMHLG